MLNEKENWAWWQGYDYLIAENKPTNQLVQKQTVTLMLKYLKTTPNHDKDTSLSWFLITFYRFISFY